MLTCFIENVGLCEITISIRFNENYIKTATFLNIPDLLKNLVNQ